MADEGKQVQVNLVWSGIALTQYGANFPLGSTEVADAIPDDDDASGTIPPGVIEPVHLQPGIDFVDLVECLEDIHAPTNGYLAYVTGSDCELGDPGLLYKWVFPPGEWIPVVNTDDLDGLMGGYQLEDGSIDRIDLWASSMPVVQVVNSLDGSLPPGPRLPELEGDQAFLTTDQRLYRYDGADWVTMDFSELTGSISAAQIIGEVVHANNIVANSITAGQIAAGAISASELAAKAVTATKVFIADYENLVDNPNFELDTIDGTLDPNLYVDAGGTWSTETTDTRGKTRAAHYDPTGRSEATPAYLYVNGDALQINHHAAKEGDAHVFAAWIKLDTGSFHSHSAPQLQVRYYGMSPTPDTLLETATLDIEPTGTWTRFVFDSEDDVGTAPENTAYVVARIAIPGDVPHPADAQFIFQDLFLRTKHGGELIVDGAISADHIQTQSLLTKHLAVGSFDNMILNASFEDDALEGANDPHSYNDGGGTWVGTSDAYIPIIGGSERAANWTSAGQTAPASLDVNGNRFDPATHLDLTPCDEGDYLSFALWCKVATPGGHPAVNPELRVTFYDDAGGELASDSSEFDPTTSWERYKLDVGTPAPASTAYCTFRIYIPTGQGGAASLSFDVMHGRRRGQGSLYVDGSITGDKIAANTIEAGHILAGSIGADELAADSIEAVHIQADAVGADEIAANSIGAGHIQADTINTSHLDADSIMITDAQIENLTADKITAGTLTVDVLYAGEIHGPQINPDGVGTELGGVLYPPSNPGGNPPSKTNMQWPMLDTVWGQRTGIWADESSGFMYFTVNSVDVFQLSQGQINPKVDMDSEKDSKWDHIGINDGTSPAPAIYWRNAPTTGWKLAPPSDLPTMVFGGQMYMFWSTTGFHPNVGSLLDLGTPLLTWEDVHITGTYYDYSDRGLKQDIRDEEAGLSFVRRLRPRRFKMKQKPDKERSGFVAQEIEEALAAEGITDSPIVRPAELVRDDVNFIEDPDDPDHDIPREYERPRATSMQALLPTLVNAIKELDERMDALERGGGPPNG